MVDLALFLIIVHVQKKFAGVLGLRFWCVDFSFAF